MENLVNQHIKALSSKIAPPPRGENAIRLDKGELPYPPSPHVIKAIADAAAVSNRYPEILGGNLRAALANYTKAQSEQIFIGNGSDDLIELIIKVFVQPGDEVLLPIPTFFVYTHATEVMGGIPVTVKRTDGFNLDIETLLSKVTPRTKVLFIANPNNPTANLVPRATLIEILERINCLLVVDECYYEMCQETVIDLIDKYPHLIILRSFSKSFGLAGLRIGYGAANATVVDYLYRAAQLFPVSKIAIAAAIAALEDLDYARANIDRICREKEILKQGLEELGFFVYPSATNFLFVKTASLGIASAQLVKGLAEKSIFVQDFGLKPGLDAYYFRTSAGTSEENQLLLKALKELI